MKNFLFLFGFLFLISACTPPATPDHTTTTTEINPPAPGFNLTQSDAKAIAIADSVMAAMGGRPQWDQLHHLAWNFFGARDLVWDKQSGQVRIDFPRDSSIYLVNINTLEGKVWRKGEELTQPDSLKKYLNIAKSIWINDSYWLVMPFKLKDSGVTLKYARTDTTLQGQTADVLQLTFQEVGNTPDNKYEVYVDQKDHLIKQWAFFKDAQQEEASAVWPWDNYKDYKGLLLSADRSDNKGPKNVRVYQELPKTVFENFEVPVLE